MDGEAILGQLCIAEEEPTELQKHVWRDEIAILKEQLRDFSSGELAFEYTIPRIGHRIDVVCIVQGLIFLLEFKVGDEGFRKSTDDQVMDYALDLKYFHKASEDRYIIPINVSTEADPFQGRSIQFDTDKIAHVQRCNKETIANCIRQALEQVSDSRPLSIQEWCDSRYEPTPTIVEAAQVMYRDHSVEEISRNDAGAKNLEQTTQAIDEIIDTCKAENRKAICFVTGVPGAGKTLAGLNIANKRHQFDEDEHAVFLSGNGPLVEVLQEALARDLHEREDVKKGDALRDTKAFIQIIHKFRDEALESEKPPIEKVAIFDEAQRAWDEEQLTKFMKEKKDQPDFNQSEPEFLIDFMDRHDDWAVIVCLVGGGQEINSGEAGMENWFEALRDEYPDWRIYLSEQMTDSEYVGDSDISTLLEGREYFRDDRLHLGVSMRSFRSEKLSEFIKLLLDNEPARAREVYEELNPKYPIVMTRDLAAAKAWVKVKARGTERYGLLANSGAKRLRSIGVWASTDCNCKGWFLNDKDKVDSSYYLEVAASEFEAQGLEIDYAVVAWDADLRYVDGEFDYYSFRGTSWNHINQEQRQKYLKNAYRVLLTRARQGFIILIPEGDPEDGTRPKEYYDGTYNYLKSIGIEEIEPE